MRAAASGAALLLLASCGAQPSGLPAFELYPSLQRGLERSAAAIEPRPEAAGEEELEPELVRGLVMTLAESTGRARTLPLEEIGTLGDPAAPTLAVIAASSEAPPGHRMAAAELLATLATHRAVEHLLQLAERSPEAWMRAQAAWRLSTIGADWTVPRLLKRLKYEVDEETAIWVAAALGSAGNQAGLEPLYRLWREGSTDTVRASAEARLVELSGQVGTESADELWRLWFEGDPEQRLLRAEPSARLEQEVWRHVEQLSGEHFQLRGVDDARFILSHLGAWATAPLSEALHDEDVYVRVHVAQVLERMGSRATLAGPVLVDALADPGLAADAALALGSVAYPSAEPVLARLAADPVADHGLRVACATSLGRIGLSASAPALEGLLAEGTPGDLQLAAARSLCQLGLGASGAAELLREVLGDPRGDRFGAELALEAWLGTLEGERAEAVREAWRQLAAPAGSITTPAEDRARLEARATLLRERWAQLNGS